ncbi:MAG: hypothetical protein V7750_10045 [Sneathiella sp.]
MSRNKFSSQTSHDPSRKYDEVLAQQKAMNERIKELGEDGYQKIFSPEEKKFGPGTWFMIFLIALSTLALINSLPINWAELFN